METGAARPPGEQDDRAPANDPLTADLDQTGGKGLRSRIAGLSRRVGVIPALGLASVADAAIVPAPLEVLMIAGMLARRDKVWTIAAAVTTGCIVGSILAFLAGTFLLDALAASIVAGLGAEAAFEEAKARFREQGLWAVAVIAVTPIPLPLGSLAAGATGMNPVLTIGLVAILRGARYYGVAAAFVMFGPQIAKLSDALSGRWLTIAMIAVGAAAIAALLML